MEFQPQTDEILDGEWTKTHTHTHTHRHTHTHIRTTATNQKVQKRENEI